MSIKQYVVVFVCVHSDAESGWEEFVYLAGYCLNHLCASCTPHTITIISSHAEERTIHFTGM